MTKAFTRTARKRYALEISDLTAVSYFSHSKRMRYDSVEPPRGAPPAREETPEEGEI